MSQNQKLYERILLPNIELSMWKSIFEVSVLTSVHLLYNSRKISTCEGYINKNNVW